MESNSSPSSVNAPWRKLASVSRVSLVVRVCTCRTANGERNRDKNGPYGTCENAAIPFVHSPANPETGVVAGGIVGREFDAGALFIVE